MLSIQEKSVPLRGEDRRAVRRQRVLKGATLSFNKGYGAFECVVRDLSAEGARLVFGDASAVPHEFRLLVGGEARARPAHVRWRSMNQIGVAFA